ncbi:hypothetical protein EMEDMD4_1290007 [Sinorhizobium medicae]|uniref:Uncharacterized protein n=1 Tax=Sinorhizobium medicae TaxID=110321 RepID=A0A508WW74_9HYPH|nr:hypothetical protein EMEDMD4_1290007 [Sinorhizobium medicae]
MLSDGPPFGRSVDPVQRVLAVFEDVQGARAQRIVRARLHATVLQAIFFQFRLPLHHIFGRDPARPLALVLHHTTARPLESGAAQRDAVAHRLAFDLDEIEEVPSYVDHNGSGRLACRIGHSLPAVSGIDFFKGDRRHRIRLRWPFAVHLREDGACACGRHRATRFVRLTQGCSSARNAQRRGGSESQE